jgi:uncharacterized damage-inducible protein DinB
MNGPLAQVLRYNAWANSVLLTACRALPPDVLDAPSGGAAYGTIRETLFHLVTGQLDFLARLAGRAQDASKPRAWTDFDAMASLAQATGDALVAAAAALEDDAQIVVPYAGGRSVFPASFFLTHALAHGVEHRTQIAGMMSRAGLTPPDLDGWQYAAAAGFGAEASDAG